MTAHEIKVDGSGKDGLLAFWEPSEIAISDLVRALKAIDKEGLLPRASVAKSALKYSLQAFLGRSGLKVRGNTPEVFPLAPEVVGYEARRMNRGTEQNEPEFVLSVVADANGEVTIPRYDSMILPQLDSKKDKAEEILSHVFASRSKVFPTEMASACIAKVIQSLGGILVRKTGGNYFVPEKSIEAFEVFATELDASQGSKPEIVTYRFPLKANDRSFKSVLRAVQGEARDRLAAVEAELSSLGSKKQRSDGKQGRTDEVHKVSQLLKDYQEILGVSLKEYQDMADKVAAAVSVHNALDWCA